MKAFKIAVLALVAATAVEVPAQAAWNNVFQPTCFFRRPRQTTSNYSCPTCVPVVAQFAPAVPACNSCQASPAPVVAQFQPPAAACAPPPTQQCTTNYVQRSFYQPVTTYESRSFYEPVTTMQTSYYYEAVTSYRTSFYPDPCNCGYIAKTCPVTSYQLKQQCTPVQSWVQRCAQVPVTSYRQSFYLEPQTTCCNTTIGAPQPVPQGAPQAAPQTPSYSSPPPIIEQPRPAPSGPNVGSTTGYYHSTTSAQPQGNWQPTAGPVSPTAPQPGDLVQGQVVKGDKAPTAHAQVLFVNAATGTRHSITTNDAGRFNLSLANGSYHVYLTNTSGAATYHSMVNVSRTQANVVSLVNN